MTEKNDILGIANKTFNSRLLIGTGKYKDLTETVQAVQESGAEIVTVALRRVNVFNKNKERLQDVLDPQKYTYLPNTAGYYTSKEAVRALLLARELGGWNLVKIEVLGDCLTLYPNMLETIKATEELMKEGFEVMVYCTDDPVMCQQLEQMKVAAIMPLAAPIGSGQGIQNRLNLEIIVQQSTIPVLVDAGIGTASDAAIAMEIGCDAVLMNTAIAEARNPIQMVRAMKLAIQAGRLAYLAGRMQKRRYASPSSPMNNQLNS